MSCICCLKSLCISAFPTRKTRRSYIYQSKSSGGCEDVLGSRRKKGRWEEPTEMHFKHVIIVAPCTSLNAYQFCVLHFWTPNWDFKQFPWLNVPLVLIIISEWNSSVKDKWNTKSIYVVGKATAALGELLSHYENTSLLKSFFLLLFSIFVVCAFFY